MHRVTSAQHIKITDKNLLQRCLPILLSILLYLTVYTASEVQQGYKNVVDEGGKCRSTWWDYIIITGER